MAISNNSGAGRTAPKVVTANNTQTASLDDDMRQVGSQIVGFTVQSMIVANAGSKNLFQIDV
jgi:hypothetical protein